MMNLFKNKLTPNFTSAELDTAFISYSEDDKLFTFRLNETGKEILANTAKRYGISMSTFVRLAIIEKMRNIYDL